jgi:hypothetical protein
VLSPGPDEFIPSGAHVNSVDELEHMMHVAANAKGNRNRMSYWLDNSPTPGWYAYTPHPDTAQL